MEKGAILKELIIQMIQFILFYFIARIFWGTEDWYNDKVKEMIFFIGASVVTIIIGLLLSSFGSPIKIKIEQKNKEFKGKHTNFFLKNSKKSLQNERTVRVIIQMERRYSIWGSIVLKLLKNISYKIELKTETRGLNLQLVNDINLSHPNSIVSSTMNGIEIDVGKYINSLLINTSQCLVSREVEYLIVEDRNNFSTTGTFAVFPKVTSTGIKSKLLCIFIRCKIEQHIVNFVRG